MKARSILLIVVAVVALAATTAYAFANAPAKGSMGVWGYVADAKNAELKVMDQPGATTLMVARAKAPQAAWIVVHTDDNGMPGERVGLKHIDKGLSTNVEVPMKGVTSDKVIVAIHADRGTPGKFDFDMNNKEKSADRPFFVNRMELGMPVAVR